MYVKNFSRIWIVVLLLFGCTNTINEDVLDGDLNYLSISNNKHFVGRETNFEFKEGNNYVIKSDGDLSYSKYSQQSNCFYMFGPGGLVQLSIKDDLVEKLSDKDINDIAIYDDRLYVYENVGYISENEYVSKIYQLHGKDTLLLNYPVQDFEINNNKLFVINSLRSSNEQYAINIYENNALIDTILIQDYGSLYRFENNIYFVTSAYLMNVETKEKIMFFDESKTPFLLGDTYNTFIAHEDSVYYIHINYDEEETTIYSVEKLVNNTIQFKKECMVNEKITNYSYVGNNNLVLNGKNGKCFIVDLNTKKVEVVQLKKKGLLWVYENLIVF